MKKIFGLVLLTLLIFVGIITSIRSEPGFNGTTPGCGGSGCHTTQAGIVSAEVLDNFQVKITVSGTSSKVGGELVDANGTVVAVINSTTSNPFILTATTVGTYTVNAGFKSPSRKWASTSAVINVTGIDEELVGLQPETFKLYANYPNPFNPATKIKYAVSQTVFTTLKVYSILGSEIATLVNEEKTPGIYELNFNASNLPSGTYIYRLQAGSYIESKKMILLK